MEEVKFQSKNYRPQYVSLQKRLFMTVIGVAGCMGLVLVGLGLHDSITVVADKQFEELTHYRGNDVAFRFSFGAATFPTY